MIPVSTRFLETVAGSHRAVARVRLCTVVPQYGSNPVGIPVPLLAGSSVRLNSTADVKAQLSISVPGDWWNDVQPYGAEFFVERGVSFGDGTEEYCPLGYYPLDDPDQASAPYGPISLDCDDRTGRLISNRIVLPWQIPAGTTHRAILERLVNGSDDGVGGYGMYRLQGGAPVPIIWTGAGYDPDTHTVDSAPVLDDSAYDFAAKLVGAQGAILRFRPTGELEVVAASPPASAPAVYALRQGRGGTLKRWSRKTSRRGFYNLVRAVGSDPAHQTGYRVARITDGPLRYNGPIGPLTRYYASPLLADDTQADSAAASVLAKSTGLPVSTQLWTVPNPALQPLDVISAPTGTGFSTLTLADAEIPLVGGGETAFTAATLNPVVEIETPENPEPTPDPPTGPGTDPDPGGGPTPGGGDPDDGTQAGLVLGWGPVIDGDECNGTTISAKWGRYDGTGHDGNGRRSAAAWSMVDGMLRCHGDAGGTTGGAAFQRGSYGYRMEARVRAYKVGGSGEPYHFVLILWPDSDEWPAGAEYDIWEGDVRDPDATAYLHLPNHTPYRQDTADIHADPATFHNYAVEWNPVAQTLKCWLDGVQYYNGSGRVAQAPGPMHPTFQLDNFGGGTHEEDQMDMQWIRIYNKPNP